MNNVCFLFLLTILIDIDASHFETQEIWSKFI